MKRRTLDRAHWVQASHGRLVVWLPRHTRAFRRLFDSGTTSYATFRPLWSRAMAWQERQLGRARRRWLARIGRRLRQLERTHEDRP